MNPTHNTKGNSAKRTTGVINRNPNFTGPKLQTALSSIAERSESIPYLEEYEYLREVVLLSKTKFCKLFYEQLSMQGTKLSVEWVESCKLRDKELSSILARIIDADETLELVLVSRTSTGYRDAYELNQMAYCPKKFAISGILDDKLVDVYINQSQPKMYGCLFVSMFKVASACREAMEYDDDLFHNLCDLALSILEVAGLYNETNPDSKTWRIQEDQTLEILTQEPQRVDDKEIDLLFQQVVVDLQKRDCPPYCKEMQNAIRSCRRYCHSPFTDDDYYYSVKSDPAYIPGFKYRQSIIKSMLETDPLVGCSFDDKVGYVSHYNKTAPEGSRFPWIKTIHITNPGKFKTRAIHLSLNAIQDRCCYIHNRLYAVLKNIPSDCTKDQTNGQLFTCTITSPEYREEHGWCSVLAYDWSNATDKMWQWFQEQCLGLVFDKEIVELWHTLSTCDKEFHHKDGEITPYKQINGQPQGLLGSFDAFAFAHHIIMLMVMKLSGLEDHVGSEFYRVLGDDSIISSIKYDPANKVGDNYVRICAWANMDINRSKSTEILYDQHVALADFAKVKVLNGEFFSPIPERIANRIGKPNQDYYAFSGAIWQCSHGYRKTDWITKIINRTYPDDPDNHIAHVLVESGILPSFRELGYYDPVLMEQDETLQMALCFAINEVKTSMISGLLGDKVKENLDLIERESDENALTTLLPESLATTWDKVEDMDHKINIAIEANLVKETTIQEIFNCTEDQSKVMVAGLSITDEEFRVIQRSLDLINALQESPDATSLYKSQILTLLKDLEVLDRLQYRSLYKRNTLDTIILKRSIRTFKQCFGRSE